ncbi:hypothetical protein [Thermodesulfovibrio sp.]|uniref:hypothetical protein n=1 Tax=Thermodesulfovibrio sp. TaxID=2067987 RepID=UPI0030AC2C3F
MKFASNYRAQLSSSFLLFACCVFLLSFFISLSIYLKKVSSDLDEDIRKIKMVNAKIQSLENFKKSIDNQANLELWQKEISFPNFLDRLNSKFPILKLEFSAPKKEKNEIIYELSAKGEGEFSKFAEILDFIENWQYPVPIIKSVTLKTKDGKINFEIKLEVREIENANRNKV